MSESHALAQAVFETAPFGDATLDYVVIRASDALSFPGRSFQQVQRVGRFACISRLQRGKAQVRHPSGAMDPPPPPISRA
jgi:hypothetical protein